MFRVVSVCVFSFKCVLCEMFCAMLCGLSHSVCACLCLRLLSLSVCFDCGLMCDVV